MVKQLLILLILSISLFAKINAEIYARWMLNSGDLMVEKGRYLEALDNYDSAFEATKNKTIKIDSLIRRSNVLLFYLNKKKEAKNYLSYIYKTYPNSKESEYALYYSAMIEKDVDKKSALKLFEKYLHRYPNGKYRFQALFFKKKLTKQKGKISKNNKQKIKKVKNVPIIRVLLKKGAKEITLNGNLIVNNKTVKKINIFFEDNNIIYNNHKFKTLIIKSKSPIYIKEKNCSYLGSILLKANRDGFDVINLIDITHYLYGVVTSESYSSWNIEALKAQAIASRTYAYYQTLVRKNWSFDVRDNTFDQAYKGFDGITKKAKIATNATKGEILMYKNRPILAQYTANSGWYSSSSKEIFNADLPYLYSHPDNFSVKMPDGKWIKKISINKLEKNLQKLGIKVIGIKNILPYSKTESGRVTKVKIIARNGEIVLRAYSSIRKAANLKDILMDIEKKGNMFYFYGGGYGHGVGYSQWGGEAMAKKGYDYKKILSFYYKDCKIKKLWGEK